jgi:hypothetical protein
VADRGRIHRAIRGGREASLAIERGKVVHDFHALDGVGDGGPVAQIAGDGLELMFVSGGTFVVSGSIFVEAGLTFVVSGFRLR